MHPAWVRRTCVVIAGSCRWLASRWLPHERGGGASSARSRCLRRADGARRPARCLAYLVRTMVSRPATSAASRFCSVEHQSVSGHATCRSVSLLYGTWIAAARSRPEMRARAGGSRSGSRSQPDVDVLRRHRCLACSTAGGPPDDRAAATSRQDADDAPELDSPRSLDVVASERSDRSRLGLESRASTLGRRPSTPRRGDRDRAGVPILGRRPSRDWLELTAAFRSLAAIGRRPFRSQQPCGSPRPSGPWRAAQEAGRSPCRPSGRLNPSRAAQAPGDQAAARSVRVRRRGTAGERRRPRRDITGPDCGPAIAGEMRSRSSSRPWASVSFEAARRLGIALNRLNEIVRGERGTRRYRSPARATAETSPHVLDAPAGRLGSARAMKREVRAAS